MNASLAIMLYDFDPIRTCKLLLACIVIAWIVIAIRRTP